MRIIPIRSMTWRDRTFSGAPPRQHREVRKIGRGRIAKEWACRRLRGGLCLGEPRSDCGPTIPRLAPLNRGLPVPVENSVLVAAVDVAADDWIRFWPMMSVLVSLLLTLRRAIRTDILLFPEQVLVTPADAPHRPRGVERRRETADDQVHADHGPSSAALRPPASASRSPHRERDRRHRPRRPSLDGAWVAGRGA